MRYQYANDLEEEIEKMRYDLYYVKHMSAWLDLGILFATLKIVLRGRESAQPTPASAVRRTEAIVARAAVAGLRLAGGARSSSETVAPLGPARAGAFETAPAALSIPATPPANHSHARLGRGESKGPLRGVIGDHSREIGAL